MVALPKNLQELLVDAVVVIADVEFPESWDLVPSLVGKMGGGWEERLGVLRVAHGVFGRLVGE